MTNISRSMPSYNSVQYRFFVLDPAAVIESLRNDTPLEVTIVAEIRKGGDETPIQNRKLSLTIVDLEKTEHGWNFEATVVDPQGQITQVLCGFEYQPTQPYHWMISLGESACVVLQTYHAYNHDFRRENLLKFLPEMQAAA